MNEKDYVLITPAKNEEKYIEKTIHSIIQQTVKPKKWVIVSDGSTDNTDSIVKKYLKDFTFIDFITAKSQGKRNFGSKVLAFNEGYSKVKKLKYHYIGNLDADVTFNNDYFDNIISIHNSDKKLGVAGGVIEELINGVYVQQKINRNSVAGAIQLFKRECFEEIGGYQPISVGGIDAMAEIKAKYKGWKVENYSQYKVFHHRRVAVRNNDILQARLRQGKMFYKLGYHPFFHFLRSISRITDSPMVFGSLFLILGYFKASMKNERCVFDEDIKKFLRNEQIEYLRRMIIR